MRDVQVAARAPTTDTERRQAKRRSALPRSHSTSGRVSASMSSWVGHSGSPGQRIRTPARSQAASLESVGTRSSRAAQRSIARPSPGRPPPPGRPGYARRVAVTDRGKCRGRAAGSQQRTERGIAGLGHEAQRDAREALPVGRLNRHFPASSRDASPSRQRSDLVALPTCAAVRFTLTTSRLPRVAEAGSSRPLAAAAVEQQGSTGPAVDTAAELSDPHALDAPHQVRA